MDGDGSSGWLQILLFIIMVVFGAYFAGSESAFSALNKIRIKSRADEGDKRAKKALYIANNFEKAITTLLIGNNITHIAAASIATIYVAGFADINDSRVSVICTVVTTLIVFLFSEMIPKAFANDRSDTMSLACAGSLKLLMKIFSPLVSFFSVISDAVSKLFGKEDVPSITEDELYDIIDTIEEEGSMDEEKTDLLKSALEFSGNCAKDVMTVRSDICSIDILTPPEDIKKIIIECKHSRIPVYEGNLDNIIGILNIRTFLKEYLNGNDFNVKDILTDVFYVKDTASIDDLLSVMRQKKIYLAVVTDECDSTVGVVTIEDFLEELVGEIWDEDDVVDSNFVKMGGNKFLVNTHLLVSDAFSKMGLHCHDKGLASRPVMSWIIESLRKTPEDGDSFTYGNLEVSVEDLEEDGTLENVVIKLNTDISPILSQTVTVGVNGGEN